MIPKPSTDECSGFASLPLQSTNPEPITTYPNTAGQTADNLARASQEGPLDVMNGNDGAVLRKEGHTLLLKAFKTLHGCVVRVCKPSFAINQPRTHHTTPKLHQSIRCLFGQIYSQVGPSRRDKHSSVM